MTSGGNIVSVDGKVLIGGRASVGTSFVDTPLQYSNLEFWYSAKKFSTFGLTGSNGISQWGDGSPKNNTLVQGVGGNLATYVANSSLNGNPAMRVDTGFSSGKFLQASTPASNFTFLHSGAGMTLIVVFVDNGHKFGSIVSTSSNGGSIGLYLFTGFSGPNPIFAQTRNASTFTYSMDADPPVGPTYMTMRTLDADPAGDDGTLRNKGIQVDSEVSPLATSSAADPSHPLLIGDSGNFSGAEYDIGEVIGYSAKRTDSELAVLENYVSKNWGIV